MQRGNVFQALLPKSLQTIAESERRKTDCNIVEAQCPMMSKTTMSRDIN